MIRGLKPWTTTPFLVLFILMLHVCRPGMTLSDDMNLSSVQGQPLELTLTLDKAMAYQGESVPFTITLMNTSSKAVSVTSFLDENRSLRITMKGGGSRVLAADQLSAKERDGVVVTERKTPEGLSLKPGKKLELKGDLLEWFGTIPGARYQVEVIYTGILRTVTSAPVTLIVTPASITAAAVSDGGAQLKDTPITSAYALKDKAASILFYRLLSPHVPRNPQHSVRAVRVEGQLKGFGAAALSAGSYPSGIVYWMKDDKNLLFTHVDLMTGSSCQPMQVGIPDGAALAGSPLLLKDRTLLVPLVFIGKDDFALVRVSFSGSRKVQTFTIEGLSNAEARTCFWEFDQKLHLFWYNLKDEKVSHTVLDLLRPSKGFIVKKTFQAPAGVVLLRPYLDRSMPAKDLRALYLGEGNASAVERKPRVKFWCVTMKNDGPAVFSVDTETGDADETVVLKAGKPEGLMIVDSAVTTENGLCILMKDSEGRLFYGSTLRGTVEPLDRISGKKVKPGESPALMASRTGAWVYLQFVRQGKGMEYIRLEPANEQDPVEMMKEGK